jgi:hypothetical protein
MKSSQKNVIRAMPTERQQDVYDNAGLPAERRAAKWLQRHHWDIPNPPSKRHRGYYDIRGTKCGEEWLVEVKSGANPNVKIKNLTKMLDDKTTQKVALLFMLEGSRATPLLFELSRKEYAAWKASDVKGREEERMAGRKAKLTRQRHAMLKT